MLFARLDPVEVPAQRIDFAVVGDHAEGVRELPLREGVGREALVDHRERGGAAGVLKVAVVDADLGGKKLPLIDHGSRRTRADVELAAVPQLQIGDGDGAPLSDDVELSFERIRHENVGAVPDEYLPYHRLLLAHDGRHRHVAVDGHVAPAEDHLAFCAHRTLDFFLTGVARGFLARQKHHPDAVFAGGRKLHALVHHVVAIELIRNLNEDASTVALQGIGADSAAVAQVLQNLERLTHDAVALLALDVRDKADAACVVLVLAPI